MSATNVDVKMYLHLVSGGDEHVARTLGCPDHGHTLYQQLGSHLAMIAMKKKNDATATSISSMITVLVLAMLLGAKELTAFSSCPLEVPTKITSNFEPSGVAT